MGNHKAGFSIWNLCVAWPFDALTVFEDITLLSNEMSNLISDAVPSISAFATNSADFRDSATLFVK